jgi:hypothetical protein
MLVCGFFLGNESDELEMDGLKTATLGAGF